MRAEPRPTPQSRAFRLPHPAGKAFIIRPATPKYLLPASFAMQNSIVRAANVQRPDYFLLIKHFPVTQVVLNSLRE